jgi:hypothetical protein
MTFRGFMTAARKRMEKQRGEVPNTQKPHQTIDFVENNEPLRFKIEMVVGDGFEPSKAKPADLQSASLMSLSVKLSAIVVTNSGEFWRIVANCA